MAPAPVAGMVGRSIGTGTDAGAGAGKTLLNSLIRPMISAISGNKMQPPPSRAATAWLRPRRIAASLSAGVGSGSDTANC